MLPRFFIDRPVFAWVIALVLMLAGGLSVVNLPIMQYPAIAPPHLRQHPAPRALGNLAIDHRVPQHPTIVPHAAPTTVQEVR